MKKPDDYYSDENRQKRLSQRLKEEGPRIMAELRQEFPNIPWDMPLSPEEGQRIVQTFSQLGRDLKNDFMLLTISEATRMSLLQAARTAFNMYGATEEEVIKTICQLYPDEMRQISAFAEQKLQEAELKNFPPLTTQQLNSFDDHLTDLTNAVIAKLKALK